MGMQGLEQAMQYQCVGNVGDMKFVKTNQLIAKRHAFAQHIKWVSGTLQVMEFAVHLAHELMKMQARFALEWDRLEKTIHQKTFAAPHTTVQIDAPGDGGMVDQFLERVATFFLVNGPLLRTHIQGLHRTQLRRIAVESAV